MTKTSTKTVAAKTTKRWALYNTRTNKLTKSFSVREDARLNKSSVHRIFDTKNSIFVR
jgi:hypothetical protein